VARILFTSIVMAIVAMQIGYLGVSRAQMPNKRYFTVAAVEPRGGVNVSQEAFPSDQLPPGGGYIIKQPDQTGRWEVSAYVWMPNQLIVNQGDEVTIEFVGINGGAHPTEIRGIGKAFTLKRGQVVRMDFKADKPGIYPVICSSHQPSMRAEIVVLPRT
jgi:plastocyanin